MPLENLTRDQRRMIGVAIAMAHADGVVAQCERDLIAVLTEQLTLGASARAEVERMITAPPTPEDIAKWCVTANDRISLYASALSIANADGVVDAAESQLLTDLGRLLRLDAKELQRARALAGEGRP